MPARLISGNEAVARGALKAGIKVATGYPGTPSTEALATLLALNPEGVHVEWSTNEKVAFEVATGAAWAGLRALCTMKMLGVNVAFDSIVSVAYSGCTGGLVLYVADDPGANAGMAEQDSRLFAAMADMPMLEAATVAQAYELVPFAFELSEEIGGPVFFRLVTATANSLALVEVHEPPGPLAREPRLIRDLTRYTKAGPEICMAQHRAAMARLEHAGRVMRTRRINHLRLAQKRGGLGIVAAGIAAAYLDEGLAMAEQYGLDRRVISTLEIAGVHPFPAEEARDLLRWCDDILVLEELEPHIERGLYVVAQQQGFTGHIFGKLDGLLPRTGEYDVSHVVRGVRAALHLDIPDSALLGCQSAPALAAARPITMCAGCPHRGTFLAINQALRRSHYRQDEVMVTGDIGCTILGMNPPFNTVWNEISMGASVSLAQGFVHAGVKTPVIATIGDSTFFHAGIPGLINAVQHQVPLTLIIMDNGWTSMTGMQPNPGTAEVYQPAGSRRGDIARLVPALGVEHFFIMDPFDLEGATATIQRALSLPGVKVVLARQECAIPAMRRGERVGRVQVVADACNLCKLCIMVTGCPALSLAETAVAVDPALCYGCGLCVEACKRGALIHAASVAELALAPETGAGV